MKKIALLLVLFTYLHLLLPQLSITATAYVQEQAKTDTSEKPGRIVSVDHIIGGQGGSAHGGGSHHGALGGGSGSSSRGSTGGTGINPLYIGGGAHGRNNHNRHSAAASNHRLFDMGLNVIVVIILTLIILTV
ncbi:uncharacterized protein LOC131235238 [Magnolia sinica]|uniref:uncharacterized protein LOC131235238 n=1 Tax=Magnolia sinica TaxID=86752 RepID=UPI002657D5D4|nr:uncharacterized protein LOC131235238 [Magnolia sinica]